MERLILETCEVQGIPILTLAHEGLERAPAIFLIHGFTSTRTDQVELGYLLARAGCFYVSLDAYQHGERIASPPPWEKHPGVIYPWESGLDRWLRMITEIVPQTARDVSTLIDHFAEDRRADIERVGVTGLSMGGMIAFYLAANEPRIQAAAPIISYPGLTAMWEQFATEAASYPRWKDAMAGVQPEIERDTARVKAVDPFERLASFAPKPLLIVQGDVDTDAPKHTSVALMQKLRPLYAEHPERLRLSIHDGVAHRVSSAMRDVVCQWFRDRLLAG